jgi:hypothetical protein
MQRPPSNISNKFRQSCNPENVRRMHGKPAPAYPLPMLLIVKAYLTLARTTKEN